MPDGCHPTVHYKPPLTGYSQPPHPRLCVSSRLSRAGSQPPKEKAPTVAGRGFSSSCDQRCYFAEKVHFLSLAQALSCGSILDQRTLSAICLASRMIVASR